MLHFFTVILFQESLTLACSAAIFPCILSLGPLFLHCKMREGVAPCYIYKVSGALMLYDFFSFWNWWEC